MKDYYSRKGAKARSNIPTQNFACFASLREISSRIHVFSNFKVTPIY